MNATLAYGAFAALGLLGTTLLFKGRAVRDWLARLYRNQRVTNHLSLPGYVLSMRLVGAGWLAFALFVFGSAIKSRISN